MHEHNRMAYSEHQSLSVFLPSLSYHSIGAVMFSDIILRSGLTGFRMLDIGAGDGQFSVALVRKLHELNIDIFSIVGLDPDSDNLDAYKKSFLNVTTSVETLVGEIEGYRTWPAVRFDIIIASHSLYEFLENPEIASEEKVAFAKHLYRMLNPGGMILLSLAGRSSHAYKVKRDVLSMLAIDDRSAYGEDLFDIIRQAFSDDQIGFSAYDSYMDASFAIASSEHIASWTRYFCRLTMDEYERLGESIVQGVIRCHATQFLSLPESFREQFMRYPAFCGSPNDETLVLPHAETLVTISAPL